MNMQQQLFNAKLAQQQKQQQMYDATQAGLQHLGGNFGVPTPNAPSPPNALDDYLPATNTYGTTTPTSLDSVRAAMQANPGADMSALLNVAKAMASMQAGPQTGLSFSEQMRLMSMKYTQDHRQGIADRRNQSAAEKAIADLAMRTSGNLQKGINEFDQGNINDYQTSEAGAPQVFETEANKILAGLLPRTQPYWSDSEGNRFATDQGSGDDGTMTYTSPSKYEQAGGQQGWKMFVADHLSPLVEHLQRTNFGTDLQIQNEIGRVIQLCRAAQGQPGGAFNYRTVMSEIVKIMEGSSQSGGLTTENANNIIRRPTSSEPVVY